MHEAGSFHRQRIKQWLRNETIQSGAILFKIRRCKNNENGVKSNLRKRQSEIFKITEK